MYMVVDVKTTEADVIAYYILFVMADVITNIFVADVITTCYSIRRWQMLLPHGRWNSHCRVGEYKWLMLLPQGRWYSHGSMILFYFQF